MLRLNRNKNGVWIGRFSNLKVVIRPDETGEYGWVGEVRTPDKVFGHAFFANTQLEKVLNQTIASFTHLQLDYEAYRELYQIVVKDEAVEWNNPYAEGEE